MWLIYWTIFINYLECPYVCDRSTNDFVRKRSCYKWKNIFSNWPVCKTDIFVVLYNLVINGKSSFYSISGGSLPKENNNYESALLCWISHACAALKKRIDQEIGSSVIDDTVHIYNFKNNSFIKFFLLICWLGCKIAVTRYTAASRF